MVGGGRLRAFTRVKQGADTPTLYLVAVPHPLLDAVRPIAEAIDATVVPRSRLRDGDIELRWEGRVVGGLRLPEGGGGLEVHVAAVELEIGASLGDLSREDKQRAVKLLSERGAFRLRKSVEDVAALLGVSRFTVYNYLNRPEG
jgi:hypothetical protein